MPQSEYSEKRRAEIAKAWDGLFRNMKCPRHERWLTYGSAARRVALHDSLMFFDLLFAKQKPWNLSMEEWRECMDGSDRQEEFQLGKLGTALLTQPLDALSAEFLTKKKVLR